MSNARILRAWAEMHMKSFTRVKGLGGQKTSLPSWVPEWAIKEATDQDLQEYVDVIYWGGMIQEDFAKIPPKVYHVTPFPDEVLREGFKTAKELDKRGFGGTGDNVSVTTLENARIYKENMVEACRIINGFSSLREVQDWMRQQTGINRPFDESFRMALMEYAYQNKLSNFDTSDELVEDLKSKGLDYPAYNTPEFLWSVLEKGSIMERDSKLVLWMGKPSLRDVECEKIAIVEAEPDPDLRYRHHYNIFEKTPMGGRYTYNKYENEWRVWTPSDLKPIRLVNNQELQGLPFTRVKGLWGQQNLLQYSNRFPFWVYESRPAEKYEIKPSRKLFGKQRYGLAPVGGLVYTTHDYASIEEATPWLNSLNVYAEIWEIYLAGDHERIKQMVLYITGEKEEELDGYSDRSILGELASMKPENVARALTIEINRKQSYRRKPAGGQTKLFGQDLSVPTLSALFKKAEFYGCKVRQEKDGYVIIFCPPGYGLRFQTIPTAIHTVRDVKVSHLTPYPINPREREPEAAKDFLEKYPGCKFYSSMSVMGSPTTILEYSCGDRPVYELSEMMEWLINTSRYALKVAYSDTNRDIFYGYRVTDKLPVFLEELSEDLNKLTPEAHKMLTQDARWVENMKQLDYIIVKCTDPQNDATMKNCEWLMKQPIKQITQMFRKYTEPDALYKPVLFYSNPENVTKVKLTVAEVNDQIRHLDRYGRRSELTSQQGYRLWWDNDSKRWYVADTATKKGVELTLDANEMFVPGTREVLVNVAPQLDPLPLYKGSEEAKARGDVSVEEGSEYFSRRMSESLRQMKERELHKQFW